MDSGGDGGVYIAPGADGPGDRGRRAMIAALRAVQAGEARARRN